MNICDSEKKLLHYAILEGVSAELIDKGILSDEIVLSKSLDLMYSSI